MHCIGRVSRHNYDTAPSRAAARVGRASNEVVDRLYEGNYAPQSDPRRRVSRPFSERRNGARIGQCPGLAVAAGRFPSPTRDGPVRWEGSSGHHTHPHRRAPTLLRPARPSSAQVWRRRRTTRIYVGRRHPYRVQARVAGLDAAATDAKASAGPPSPYGGGNGQSAWRSRDVSGGHALSNPRLQ
jgi:hypothetical protein